MAILFLSLLLSHSLVSEVDIIMQLRTLTMLTLYKTGICWEEMNQREMVIKTAPNHWIQRPRVLIQIGLSTKYIFKKHRIYFLEVGSSKDLKSKQRWVVLTMIFPWVGDQSNLPLLTTGLSGLHFGGVISYYTTLSKLQEWRMLCHYLLDRQATKLFVWRRWAIYLSSWYGQKVGGDCLGDRRWRGLLCLGFKIATLWDVLSDWHTDSNKHFSNLKCFQYDTSLEVALLLDFKWTSKEHAKLHSNEHFLWSIRMLSIK